MKRKILILLIALVSLYLSGWSQQYQRTGLGIKTTIDSINVEVQFYSPEIVRILKSPTGISYEKKSLSVVKVPVKEVLKVNQQEGVLAISSKSVLVKINAKTGVIGFYTASGAPLLNEEKGGVQFTPRKDGEENTYAVRQSFQLKIDEPIYGLGQHQKGLMNQRNQKLELRQANMQIAVPFFQSVKGYGLIINLTSI